MKQFKELEQRDPWFFIIIALILYFGVWLNTYFAENRYIFYYSYGGKEIVTKFFEEGIGEDYSTEYEEIAAITNYVHSAINYDLEERRIIEALQEEQSPCGVQAYIEYLILQDRGYKCYAAKCISLSSRELHRAVAVLIGEKCYIADPTNNILLPIREYNRRYELTPYWARKLQKFFKDEEKMVDCNQP